MPGDETYVHLIDALAGNGPLWLLVAGLLVVLAGVAVKYIPIIRDAKKGDLEIARLREERKDREVTLRDERDRENAANSARMIDAMKRQATADEAMAKALDAMTMRIDASQSHSAAMGEQVEKNHETLLTVAHQVDDIHAVTVRSKR